MAINRYRVRQSPPNPPTWGEMRALVDVPGAEWYKVQDVACFAGDYSYSAINDEAGPRTHKTRPCEHVRVSVSNSAVQIPGFSWRVGNNIYQYSTTGGMCTSYSGVPERSDFGGQIDSFNRRAVRMVVDEVPTSVSLPTFIGEIKDIPRTLQSIKDLITLGKEGLNPRRYENFRELRAMKDRLSDPVLGWNFGIAPLWRDVEGFLGAQLGVNRAIDRLRRTRGKVTKFRIGGTVKGSTYKDSWSPAGAIGPLGVEARWSGSSSVKMRAGGTYFHELGGLDTFAGQEAALRSSLGFDNLFKSAWDLVPFSFLADYVSNIGDLLSELKTNDAFTGDIRLSDTWSTTKQVSVGTLSVRFVHPDGHRIGGGTMVSGTIERFNRSQGIPTTAGLLLNTSVSSRELVNIAALV